MQETWFRATLLAVVCWMCCGARAADLECVAGNVRVVDSLPEDAQVVCEAARAAAEFLLAHGFEIKASATVSVVEALTAGNLPSGIGTYDAKRRHAEALSYAAALRLQPDRPAFGIPMNRDLYRSFLVHEIAHAIADSNFVARPIRISHEYIAYTTQLATMPKELRENVLRNVATDGFEHLKEMSEVLLMIDPNRFAVKAYLHFQQAGNGARTFAQLLTGRF